MNKILIATFDDVYKRSKKLPELSYIYSPFVNTLKEGLLCKYKKTEIKVVTLPSSESFKMGDTDTTQSEILKKFVYNQLNTGDVYIHISFNLINYVDFKLLKDIGVNTIYYETEGVVPTKSYQNTFNRGLPNEVWTYNLYNLNLMKKLKNLSLCKLRCVYPGYIPKSTLKQTDSNVVCALRTFKYDNARKYNFRVLNRRGTFSNFKLKLIKWNSDKEFCNLTQDTDSTFSGIMLNMYKQSKLPRHRGRQWAFPINTAMLSEVIGRGFIVVSDTPYSGNDKSLNNEMELYRECGIFCCITKFGNAVSDLQSLALDERQEVADNFKRNYESLFSPKNICESLDII